MVTQKFLSSGAIVRSLVAILLVLFAGISLKALNEKEYLEAKDEYDYQKSVMDRQFQAEYEKYLYAKERAQCPTCYPDGYNKIILLLVESNWNMWKAIANEQYSLLDEKWQEVEKTYELAAQQKKVADDSWKLHPSRDQFFPYDTRGTDKRQKERFFSLRKLQKTLERHPGEKRLKNHRRALVKLQNKMALEEDKEGPVEPLEILDNGDDSTEQVTPPSTKRPQVPTERPQFRREEHRQQRGKPPQVSGAQPKSRPYVCQRNKSEPAELTVATCAAIYFNGLWW